MNNVLLLGAGMVAGPLISYLLDHGLSLTVATNEVERAEGLVGGHPAARVLYWEADDRQALVLLLEQHQIAVSLLPAPFHPQIARACISQGKPMVTTSYVSDKMQALDQQARRAGVVLLNELGVDPGIDHMSAMRMIHDVTRQGGRVTSFRSYCGGLPAPDANDNPWGYKFSWSPLAVLRASTNGARYLKNGVLVERSPEELFLDTHPMSVEQVGLLEAYPNRDSLVYRQRYGLDHVETLFRGTLRYPGWSETMRRVGELGLLDETTQHRWGQLSWAKLMARQLGASNSEAIRQRLASRLWLPMDSDPLERLAWLGLFSDDPLPLPSGSIMAQLSEQMQRKMCYAEGQRDMIVMHHELVADHGQRQELTTSTMVDFGVPGGHSSMARTVGLPAAIATRLVLDGTINEVGVQIPVQQRLYQPILEQLDHQGIRLVERTVAL